MDLKLLEDEYSKLKEVVLDSIESKESALWEVCYRWWTVFRVLNEQLAGKEELCDRDAIVASFAAFQEELGKEFQSGYENQGVDLDKVVPLDDKFDSYPKHMKDIILVMRMQRARFIDQVKAIKAEKEGKGTQVTRKLSKKKRGWIKT